MIARLFAVLFVALLLGGTAGAATVEEIIELPVEVTDIRGRVTSQPITVTIFRDDSRTRSPFLILNHGRTARAERRAALGRARYSNNARYFVSLGFAVFVPTRVGYGVTGGPDVEHSGDCRTRNYPPVYEAAAQQSLRVIERAKSLPYVDPAKGLVVGQSFGGTTAIAIAAKNTPGVRGAVNFAGGGGGNPEKHPEQPCRSDLMGRLFDSYGATATMPTLWVYSENDRYWGQDFPQAWFKSFVEHGGKGRFVQLPPSGEDGHSSFTANPIAWRPAFEEFLRELDRR